MPKVMKVTLSKVELERLYWEKKHSRSEIAILLGCTPEAVKYAFNKLEIATRTYSEAK